MRRFPNHRNGRGIGVLGSQMGWSSRWNGCSWGQAKRWKWCGSGTTTGKGLYVQGAGRQNKHIYIYIYVYMRFFYVITVASLLLLPKAAVWVGPRHAFHAMWVPFMPAPSPCGPWVILPPEGRGDLRCTWAIKFRSSSTCIDYGRFVWDYVCSVLPCHAALPMYIYVYIYIYIYIHLCMYERRSKRNNTHLCI